ncbi:hypothetical protein ERO13_A13G010750v2 [Gossypium hirsutum]|uniref:Uncharacterized protein n=2 Tax=Gossypium TaxID=3633 RepID=A0A5J5STI2_GOSBA|nr:hypothetical protein ES319_A13G012400v1 [Gossypium barbadense]KAG4164366.1 hypothetical protein ERO13_A13G010750v2 [Gossypium hirsutum]TYI99353.1 hypothetical protein E1A91_A13G012000v1 [Gossypium mustelinum]
MGFPSEVYMDLGSPTSITDFWDVVLQRFISQDLTGLEPKTTISQSQDFTISIKTSFVLYIFFSPTSSRFHNLVCIMFYFPLH